MLAEDVFEPRSRQGTVPCIEKEFRLRPRAAHRQPCPECDGCLFSTVAESVHAGLALGHVSNSMDSRKADRAERRPTQKRADRRQRRGEASPDPGYRPESSDRAHSALLAFRRVTDTRPAPRQSFWSG